MPITISGKVLERVKGAVYSDIEELLGICERNNICPKCGGDMVTRQNNEKWCNDCGWSRHMSLARALLQKVNNFGIKEGFTWDNFYDEMLVPEDCRSDFATIAILKQATEIHKKVTLEKSFGDI